MSTSDDTTRSAGSTTGAESTLAPGRRTAGGITGATHALLRIGAGILFMFHGMPKLFGWFGGMGEPGQSAALFSQMGLAGVLEVFGGLMIVVGLATRPVAIVLAIEMLWAYLQAHLPQGWVPLENGGEPALLFLLIYLFLATHGPGPASIDANLSRRWR